VEIAAAAACTPACLPSTLLTKKGCNSPLRGELPNCSTSKVLFASKRKEKKRKEKKRREEQRRIRISEKKYPLSL
jgi:hypothetical protein